MLDEATSSLDGATDLEIQSALRSERTAANRSLDVAATTINQQLLCQPHPIVNNDSDAVVPVALEDAGAMYAAAQIARSEGITVVSITHRLDLIADSDLVVVIDGGHVSECAPPRELLAKGENVLTTLVAAARKTLS